MGWNKSDVSSTWPGDQLDEEDEDWAGATPTQTNVTASDMKFPIRNMSLSLLLAEKNLRSTPHVAQREGCPACTKGGER
jgi:hypothetical protein